MITPSVDLQRMEVEAEVSPVMSLVTDSRNTVGGRGLPSHPPVDQRQCGQNQSSESQQQHPSQKQQQHEEQHHQKQQQQQQESKTTQFDKYNLYHWEPSTNQGDDENFMDMTMLVTRNSTCLQGHTGCIIVNPRLLTNPPSPPQHPSNQAEARKRLERAVMGTSTNLPLYSELNSDVHAEIAALGQCSRRGNATEGCTAYVTIPPCKRCFAALVVAGIGRIVVACGGKYPDCIVEVAKERGVELVRLDRDWVVRQGVRLEGLVSLSRGIQRDGGDANNGGFVSKGVVENVGKTDGNHRGENDDCNDMDKVMEQRKRRREEKKLRKERARRKTCNIATTTHNRT